MSTVSEHAHRRTEAEMHKQGQQPISRIFLYSKSRKAYADRVFSEYSKNMYELSHMYVPKHSELIA